MILIIIISLAIIMAAIRYYYPQINGFIGEKVISLKLYFLDKEKYIVLNNILLKHEEKTTQIDHLVISIYGIFVIETKNHKGWIFGHVNNDYWTQNIWGNKYSLYNPIFQNSAHIKFLKRILSDYKDVPYYSIIVFNNASSLRIYGNSENVLYRSELNSYIRFYNEEKMDFSTCKEIAEILTNEKEINRKIVSEHKHNVRKTIKKHNNMIANNMCPLCGRALKKRHGAHGIFFGCSGYPYCNYTRKYD